MYQQAMSNSMSGIVQKQCQKQWLSLGCPKEHEEEYIDALPRFKEEMIIIRPACLIEKDMLMVGY